MQRAWTVNDNRISQLTFLADFEPWVGRGVGVLAPLRTWPDPPHCNAWYTTSTKYYTKRLQKYGVRHHVAKVHHNHKLLCITHYESLVLYTPQRTPCGKVCCDLTPRVCSASPPQPIIPFKAEHGAANTLYHVHNHQDALKILFSKQSKRFINIHKQYIKSHWDLTPTLFKLPSILHIAQQSRLHEQSGTWPPTPPFSAPPWPDSLHALSLRHCSPKYRKKNLKKTKNTYLLTVQWYLISSQYNVSISVSFNKCEGRLQNSRG